MKRIARVLRPSLLALSLVIALGCSQSESTAKVGLLTPEELLSAPPADALILDVREQPVDGILLGALPIAESQLKDRFAEVPKEKRVVIHCNTGILAKNAYDLLVAKGHEKVRYLNAVIVIGSNGSYDLTEK